MRKFLVWYAFREDATDIFAAYLCVHWVVKVLAHSGQIELETPGLLSTNLSGGSVQVRPTRVLVVEDERHIARLLQFVLGRAGYELTICHSAEQALLEIEKGKPDALILDLVLPGMTGLELLHVIRAAPYLCTCAVVVLSSHWLEQSDTTLAEAGAIAQCSKPIAPSSLLRKLQQLGVPQSMPLDN